MIVKRDIDPEKKQRVIGIKHVTPRTAMYSQWRRNHDHSIFRVGLPIGCWNIDALSLQLKKWKDNRTVCPSSGC